MTTNRGLALALLLLALAACKDAPTMPPVLQQVAGGEEWVAVRSPERLPGLESWLPYLEPSSEAESATLDRVRQMRRQAEQARDEGRLRLSEELTREATHIAVISLTQTPDQRIIADAISGIDLWLDRARREVALDEFPVLAASVRTVQDSRAAAAKTLAAGDTMSAAYHLSLAAARIREHSPFGVALRVLMRVEERVMASDAEEQGIDRALHLLGSAREELVRGDASRALQRALYALQIAEGNHIGVRPEGQGVDCGGSRC